MKVEEMENLSLQELVSNFDNFIKLAKDSSYDSDSFNVELKSYLYCFQQYYL
jgi:hypothetical protein